MELYVAEYRHVFTQARRIILFEAREDWYKSIANQLAGNSEYLYEVQEATAAMGLQTNLVKLEYVDKKKKKFKAKYGRFSKPK